MQGLILDSLIVVILLLLMMLGFQRGGLREMCTGAGLLLGVAIVSQWADRWGQWLADTGDLNDGASRFVVAVGILVVTTLICGYGATAAFAYQPGPGGRAYGVLLGLMTGVVFIAYVIEYVRLYLFDGDYPKAVDQSYLGRGLTVGIDWVLLGIGVAIIFATAFGWLVREDPSELPTPVYAAPVAEAPRRRAATAPSARPVATATEPVADKIEPASEPEVQTPTSPLRIREVRHWEEPQPAPDPSSGWATTWPVSSTGSAPKPPWESGTTRRRSAGRPSTPSEPTQPTPPANPTSPTSDADVLRQWLEDDDETR